MKNTIFKILILLLIIAQVLAGVKLLIPIKQGFISQEFEIALINKIAFYLFIVISFVISVICIILISRTNKENSNALSDKDLKAETRDKKEQKLQKEEERQRQLALNEQKKSIINELRKDLSSSLNLQSYCEKTLINLSKHLAIMQALYFVKDKNDKVFRKAGSYAFYREDELREFTEDIGLSGQVAANKKLINISNIPENYITVHSGLGKSTPSHLIILPVLYNNESIGIIEIASFNKFDSFWEEILTEFSIQTGQQLAEIREKNQSVEEITKP
ncbi:MAG: GAF domain-containing protein [Bacteroidales bacterium]